MVTAARWQQEGPRAQATSNGDKAAWLPQLVLSRHQPGTGLGSGSDVSAGALERCIMGSQGGQGLWESLSHVDWHTRGSFPNCWSELF